jgi:general secretion pathway protein I
MNRRGFTLLEVMIAVAILGLSLTAIFSSEVGAANIAQRARRQNTAATLARCKMSEIEQLVAIEGLPLLDKTDQDNCCEHAPVEGYECEWIIERIILPEFGGDEEGEDEEGELPDEDRSNRQLEDTVDQLKQEGGPPPEVVAGEAGNLAVLALQLAFPILKPFLEEQVRRATVAVRWREGDKERGFDVTQYLVSEQIASEDPNAPIDEEATR